MISKILSRSLKSPVTINKIRTDFLNSIVFEEVSIGKEDQIKANKIGIHFQPWTVINIDSTDKKIFLVTIDNPNINVGLQNQNKSLPLFIPLPDLSFRAKIINGEINIGQKEQNGKFSNINGNLSYSPESILASLKANDGNANLRYERRITQDWKSWINFENLNIAPILHLTNQYSQQPGSFTGKVNAQILINGKGEKLYISEDNWKITLETKELNWKHKKNNTPVWVEGKVTINSKQASVHLIALDKSIFLRGEIYNPLDNPNLNIELQTKHFNLNRAKFYFPPQSGLEYLSGPSELSAQIKGSPRNPFISGTFNIKPVYGPTIYPELVGLFSLDKEQLKGSASFSDGTILVTGTLNKRNQKPLQIELKNISLAPVAKENGWRNVNGIFSADLGLTVKRSIPHLSGDFSLNELKWGRHRKRENITGAVSARPDAMAITTRDESLILNLSINQDFLSLNAFKIDFGGDSYLTAQGRKNYKQGHMSFSVTGKKIPPDIWPPLVARYPDINGSLDFSGSVVGSTGNPQFYLDVLINKGQFLNNGNQWNGSTTLKLNKSELSLEKISIDGGVRGNARMIQKNKKWDVVVDLNLNESPPALFTDIFKTTVSVSGSLTGTAQLKYKNDVFLGNASMAWENGNVDQFKFDQATLQMTSEGNNIVIDDFNVIRQERALRSSGHLKNEGGLLKYTADVQMQQWGSNKYQVDGDSQLKGQLDLKNKSLVGTMTSPVLWINQYPLDALKIKYVKDNEKIGLDISGNDQVKGKAEFNFEKNQLNGNFSGKDIQIKPLTRDFFELDPSLGIPEGMAHYSLNVRGEFDNPQLTVKIISEDMSWRHENLDTEIFMEIEDSTFSLTGARIKIKNGGTIFASGLLPYKNNSEFNLSGAGTDISLNSVFRILRWPVVWDGKTNASFKMTGAQPQTELTILFDGQHNGYGPFPDGGTIVGSIKSTNKQWDISQIRVTSGNGYTQLRKGSEIYLDKNGAGRIRIVADTRNLKSGVLTYFGQVELAGLWDTQLEESENNNKPLEFDVFARSLWINQFVLNGNITHLTIKDKKVIFSPIVGSGQQLSGELNYKNYPDIEVSEFKFLENGIEQVYLDGHVGVNFWDFKARLREIDASVVRGLFDTLIPISGPTEMKVTAQGSLNDPIIEADVRWKEGKLGPIPLDLGTAHVSLKDGVVDIDNIWAIKKKGYVLRGNIKLGTALLSDDQNSPTEIDLEISKGNFGLITSIWNEASKAKGSYHAKLKVDRENEVTNISGFLEANDLYLRSSSYFPLLKKGELKMEFDKNRLKISRAQAKIGDGTAILSGFIDFDDMEPSIYNISLNTPSRKGISIRIPQLAIPPGPILGRFNILKRKLAGISRGEPKINLTYFGPAANPTLKGEVLLENSVFTYPPTKDNPGEKKHEEFTRWLNDYEKKINWDVIFTAGDKTQYENKLVNADIEGFIHLLGPSSDMDINGRIESEKGSIIYAGNEFKINQATLETITEKPQFSGIDDKQIFVYLKVDAERDVYYTDFSGNNVSDTILMRVDRSLLGEIQPRFSSKNNSNLSSEKAFQLAMGISLKESLEEDYVFSGQQSVSKNKEENVDVFLRASLVQLLDSSLASPLARAITSRTGLVDSIRLTYEDSGATTSGTDLGDRGENTTGANQNEWWRQLKGTKVSLGRELSGRLFADYRFKVDEFKNELDFRHEVELAYRLHRNLYIRATSELDTERTLGRSPDRRALLENRWRFGLPKKKRIPKITPPIESD